MRLVLCALFLLALLAACSSPAAPASGTVPSPQETRAVTLTVFAASSLTSAFQEIGKTFENVHPGTRVAFSFAGSQQLRSQIEQGAQADVFASADDKNMAPLQSAGLLAGQPQVFAHNRLAIIVPNANPAHINQLSDLSRPGYKLVVADPSVPVGSYALQALDKMAADPAFGPGFKAQVIARIVSRENNVSQVVSKVALGEADAGIVYTTDAQGAASKLTTIDIPDRYNIIAAYPIAVLKPSVNPSQAQAFIDLVLSSAGQSILAKYGFAAR